MPPGYGYAPYDTGGNFDLAYFGLRSDDPSVVDPRTGFTTFPTTLPSGESLTDFFVRTYNEGGNPYYGAVGANNNLLPFLQQSTDPRIQQILPQLQANQLSRTGDQFSFFGDNLLPALALFGGAVGGAALAGGGAAAGGAGAGAGAATGAGAGGAGAGGLGAGTAAGLGGAGAAGAGGAAALGGAGAAGAGAAGGAGVAGTAAGAGGLFGSGITAGQALGLAGTLGSGIAGLVGGSGNGAAEDVANQQLNLANRQQATNEALIARILGLQDQYAAQTDPIRQSLLGGSGALNSFLTTGALPGALQQQLPSVPDVSRAQRQNLERQFRQADQQLLDISGSLGGQLNAGRIALRAQRGQAATALADQQLERQYQQDLGQAQQFQNIRNQLFSAGLGVATGQPAQQFGALGQAGALSGSPSGNLAGAGALFNQLGQQNAAQQANIGQGLGASLALLGATLPNLFGGGATANPYLAGGNANALGFPQDYVSLSSATPNLFGTY